jgi:hypothetical protein
VKILAFYLKSVPDQVSEREKEQIKQLLWLEINQHNFPVSPLSLFPLQLETRKENNI